MSKRSLELLVDDIWESIEKIFAPVWMNEVRLLLSSLFHKNGPFAIFCHVVYATLGYTLPAVLHGFTQLALNAK